MVRLTDEQLSRNRARVTEHLNDDDWLSANKDWVVQAESDERDYLDTIDALRAERDAANVITEDEFAELTKDSSAVDRLKDYDALRAERDVAVQAAAVEMRQKCAEKLFRWSDFCWRSYPDQALAMKQRGREIEEIPLPTDALAERDKRLLEPLEKLRAACQQIADEITGNQNVPSLLAMDMIHDALAALKEPKP